MDAVGAARAPGEIYESALTCLRHGLAIERASILLFDESNVMRFVAWRGLSDEYRRAVDGHAPWSADEKHAAPILVPDVCADASLRPFAGALEREGIRALAFVPLQFGEKLLGKFMLYYRAPHEFTEEEISLARVVSGHLAFALEHARVKKDLERRLETEQEARQHAEQEIELRRRLETQKNLLMQAGQTLSRSLDPQRIFAELSRLCVPAFADWYAIHLVDDKGRVDLAHIAHRDPDKIRLARVLMKRWRTRMSAHTGAGYVIKTGRAQLIERIRPQLLAEAARDREHLELLNRLELHSAVVVPLMSANQPIGAMTFLWAESKRSYDLRDLALVETLADCAALALVNARLYREAKNARESAEKAAKRLDILATASQSLAPALDPADALEQLARFAVPTLADYCIAYRLDEDGTIQRVGLAHADETQQRLLEDLHRSGPPELDRAGAGQVLRTGQPILAADITYEMLEVSAQNEKHLEVLEKLAPRSSLLVPLKARGRTLGALAFATTDFSGRRYGQADVAFAQDLADRAALLVDNARLYTQAREATRLKDDMLAVVSHDLRSPLNAIVTACELLELDAPEERRARTRASIRRAAKQMSRLLEALLDVTRIEAGRLALQKEPFDISSLIAEIVSMHEPVADDRSIRLVHATPAVEIVGDRDRLAQALANLVDNALKFTPIGGEIVVTAERCDRAVRVCVSDTGAGIPADELPRLFDRFWRAERSDLRGIGLGLTISKGIAEAHGGSIEVQSRLGVGSTFALVLPVQEGSRAAVPSEITQTAPPPIDGGRETDFDRPRARA